MYKIENSYEGPHIMDLNLMEAQSMKSFRVSFGEILATALPLVLIASVFLVSAIPEWGFLIECQNVPGGDLCQLNFR